MKVLHLIQYLDIGGIERLVQTLCLHAAAEGGEHVVAAYCGSGPIERELTQAGVKTVVLGPGSGRRPELPLQVVSLIRRLNIDVLHTHHLGPYIYGCPAARLSGVGHVHTEHSVEFYDTRRRRWVGRTMARFASVVCVSGAVAQWRRRHLNVAPGTESVINNGVDTPIADSRARASARLKLGVADDTFLVGTVGRLAAEKDQAVLIDGFSRLDHPATCLVLIGEGPRRASLEEQCRRLGISDRVRFMGARSDVPELLPALDVFALTSVREGLPLAVLEAMATGLPIVATAVGSLPDLLSDDSGWLINVGAADELAAVLTFAASEPELRRNVGETGRSVVAASYSSAAMTSAYQSTYRAAIHGRYPHTTEARNAPN